MSILDLLDSLLSYLPFHILGNVYNIPIQVWLLASHPSNAPLVHVCPTSNMIIKPSKHVDHSGRVYLPYLSEWKSVSVLF